MVTGFFLERLKPNLRPTHQQLGCLQMRATLNILFGMILLFTQGMAALAPHSVELETICQCCSCGSSACSTPQRTPTPPSSPVAVQEASRESEKVSRPAHPPVVTSARVLPGKSALRPQALLISSLANQSLHQRLCVLLI